MIQFPKEKSIRKLWQDKSQNQKSAMALSLVSVLMVTVFVNEWIASSRQQQAMVAGEGRGLASVSQENTLADIKWEHDMARQLASAELARPAVIAQKVSLRDELVFGRLQGKYGVKTQGGLIVEAEFLAQNAGDEPLVIADKAQFLKSFGTLFAPKVAKVSLKKTSSGVESYNLIDDKNNILGQAEFHVDDQGRVLNLKVTQ